MLGLVPFVIGLLAQFGVAFALFRWGRTLAHTRPGALWRWLARAPLLALSLALAGGAVVAVILARAFAAASVADPSMKATELARGISEAMNTTAFFLFGSLAIYLICTIVFFISWLRSS